MKYLLVFASLTVLLVLLGFISAGVF